MKTIKGHTHLTIKEAEEEGYELSEALDMRDERLLPGVLIKCEFCDTMVWLNEKNWEIVTCENPSCMDSAIRRYCV